MFTYTDILKLHPGHGGWNFILIPENLIPVGTARGGWGSIKVECFIGATSWVTSMFYMKQAKGYFLGIKKKIREKEDLYVGDIVEIKIRCIHTA